MKSLIYKLQFFLLTFVCISSLSCKKFLETYSQNDSFINTATDLEELLIADGYFDTYASPFAPVLFQMDDDVSIGILSATNRHIFHDGYYTWRTNPRINSEGQLTSTDDYFQKFYQRIARLNTILEGVSNLKGKGESESKLNKIAGEAHFLRAYYYFFLANAFGKPYKEASAESDYSVPLKIESAIKEQFARRANNKQVFSQIVADLLAAERLLMDANENSVIRVNRSVVHTLLSRVYLFMENYEQSILYADLAIRNNKYRLADLNAHTAANNFLSRQLTEVQFTMCHNRNFGFAGLGVDIPFTEFYIPSDKILNSYETNDLRRSKFYVQNSKGTWKFAKQKKQDVSIVESIGDMFMIRISEAYLNKAEALAVLGREGEAINTVQQLRANRFASGQLPEVTQAGAGLVSFIREERRRELFLEGHRWFDIRRYAVNSKFPHSEPIIHRNISFTGSGYAVDGYYELGTYDSEPASYVLPIAIDEIEFNQGLLKNEDRPERSLKH